MHQSQLEILKECVLSYFDGCNVGIVLFGSRAKGTNAANSDVDIGLLHNEPLNRVKISLLREKIENMNIIYKVDIVDFAVVTDEFRNNALKDAVVWKTLD
jgi:uncharacterized protein